MMAAAQMGIPVPGMPLAGFAQPPAPQPPSHDAAQATGLRRIFVGGVPFDIHADQVKAVFSPFGTILRCDLLPDPTNPARHRCVTCFPAGLHFIDPDLMLARNRSVFRSGYGFIEYESPQSAQEALRGMDGFMLGGRILKVGWATNAPPTAYAAPPTAAVIAAGATSFQPAQQRAEQIAAMISANTVGQHAAAAAQRDTSLSAEENVTISSSARQELMQKLSARAQMPSTDHFKCVMLTNMVELAEADDPELKEEVADEARRYGAVDDVAIKVRNNQVFVYLLYHEAASAKQAVAALNNRYVPAFLG
jgi:poly(U)-binding-splicing factor PUF60